MKELLYRGREIKTKIWRFGYYAGIWKFDDKEYAKIIDSKTAKEYYVEIETVARDIGVSDKNGKDAFEGDIVKMHYFFTNYNHGGAFEDEKEIICKLTINPLGLYFESKDMSDYVCNYIQELTEELEVIGNIHDNPELLEETK